MMYLFCLHREANYPVFFFFLIRILVSLHLSLSLLVSMSPSLSLIFSLSLCPSSFSTSVSLPSPFLPLGMWYLLKMFLGMKKIKTVQYVLSEFINVQMEAEI